MLRKTISALLAVTAAIGLFATAAAAEVPPNTGSITIVSTDEDSSPAAGQELTLYANANIAETDEVTECEGETLYLVLQQVTDENGCAVWTDLPADDETWYAVLLAGDDAELIPLCSLPYSSQDPPAEGYSGYYCEDGSGGYRLYNLNLGLNPDGKISLLDFVSDSSDESEEDVVIAEDDEEIDSEIALYAYGLDNEDAAYTGSAVNYSTIEPGKLSIVEKHTVQATGYPLTAASHFILQDSSGRQVIAFCTWHDKDTPAITTPALTQTESIYDSALLRKVLYYGYLGPGDESYTFTSPLDSTGTLKTEAYITAIACSTVYANNNTGMLELRSTINGFLTWCESQADPATLSTTTKITLSGSNTGVSSGTMHWTASGWESDTFKVNISYNLGISYTVPSGVSLVYTNTAGKQKTAAAGSTVTLYNGYTFKIKSDLATKPSSVSLNAYTFKAVVGTATTGESNYNNRQPTARLYAVSTPLKLSLSYETAPTIKSLSASGSCTQTVTFKKVDPDGTTLSDAVFIVTADDGTAKSVTTDSKGAGSASFSYSVTSGTYSYVSNYSSLSASTKTALGTTYYTSQSAAQSAANADVAAKIAAVKHTYTIKEKTAPSGYTLNTSKYTVTGTGIGTFALSSNIVDYQAASIASTTASAGLTQSIFFKKTDIFGNPLSGAVFEISNGTDTKTVTSDENGLVTCTFEYENAATSDPIEYVSNYDKLSSAGQKTYKSYAKSEDEAYAAALTAAQTAAEKVTHTYTVTEVTPPDGCDPIEMFTLTGTGSAEITCDDVVDAYHGSVTVLKVNGSNVPLEGVTYHLENADDPSVCYDAVTDAEGKALFDNLADGDYVLTETSTLDGYTLLSESVQITMPYVLSAEDAQAENADTSKAVWNGTDSCWNYYDLNYRITDCPQFNIPLTGGPGFLTVITAGLFLCLCGAGLYFFSRRRTHN